MGRIRYEAYDGAYRRNLTLDFLFGRGRIRYAAYDGAYRYGAYDGALKWGRIRALHVGMENGKSLG